GDGAAELVAPFGARDGQTSAGAVLVCKVTAGIPTRCDDIVATITALEPKTSACIDAAPGHLAYRDPTVTPTGAADLAVACYDDGSTIYRVFADAAGYHAEKLAHLPDRVTRLQLGDVTGDGIDDVVALAGDAGAQSLVVLRQCTSRDITACQRSSDKEKP